MGKIEITAEKIRQKRIVAARRENAYLTVEAALVMPIVLVVIMLTVYLLFFQYDRCLMEQDMGILAMRGCTLQAESQGELAAVLSGVQNQMDTKKYVAWSTGQIGMTLQGGKVTVERAGYLRFPVQRMAFWKGGGKWETSVKFKNQRIQPMVFIRNCRRLMGGK